MNPTTSYQHCYDWRREQRDAAEEAADAEAEAGKLERIAQAKAMFPALWATPGAIFEAAVAALETAAWDEAWKAAAAKYGVE